LLFRSLTMSALVMTSGNISEEPIITDDSVAEKKLLKVADCLVSYNRRIVSRTDDSVIRVANDQIGIIRRSRGFVPRPVDIDINVEGILALGAEQKNSFCIGKSNQAILSQYIGDLKNLSACNFYREMIDRFTSLFRFRPQNLACDMHPDYYSTYYASVLSEKYNIPVVKVQHHHAHIVSCMAEHCLDESVIGICFDGTGFGTDRNTWGGEFLIADRLNFNRYTHFDYVPMPGGDKVTAEPWRMAFSYLYKYFGDNLDYNSLPLFRSVNAETLVLVKDMIKNQINCPLSSGAGRLFDAVSSLIGICPVASFDSEAPMRLESAINSSTKEYYPYYLGETIVFEETFAAMMDDMQHLNVSLISTKFHNTLARLIVEVSEKIRNEYLLNKVVLSGGVFQNKYLLEKIFKMLTDNGFIVFTNNQVPANDGGIALGQLVVASKTFGLCV